MPQFIHPLDDHILTRDFYYESIIYVGEQHAACDYIRRTGTTRESPIRAVADGVVVGVGWDRHSGYFIAVAHANGWRSTYRHLIRSRAASTPAGSSVSQGQHIGHVGSTGVSQGNHLHFDLWCTTKHDNGAFAKHGLWAHDPELYLGKEDEGMATVKEITDLLNGMSHNQVFGKDMLLDQMKRISATEEARAATRHRELLAAIGRIGGAGSGGAHRH